MTDTATIPASKYLRWLKIVLLGCALGLLLVCLCLAVQFHYLRRGPADFTLSRDAVREELTRVIGLQLAAFRKDDFAGVYSFAGASLREEISPAAFEEMVRTGFPAIARSRSASYGIILDNGENAAVNVSIVGASGVTTHYQYLLHRDRTGWKIIGVTRISSPGITV